MRKEWLKPVRDFYQKVMKEWEFEESEIEILKATCDRLNRFYKCKRQIQKDGQSYVTQSGMKKCHPLLPIEQKAFVNFLAGIKALDLKEEEPKRPAHRPAKGFY